MGQNGPEGLSARVWKHANDRGFAKLGDKPEQPVPSAGGAPGQSGSAAPPLKPADESLRPAAQEPAAAKKLTLSQQVTMRSPAVLGFFSSFLLIQLIVEATSWATPQMADPFSQGFIRLAAVSSCTYLAYAIGSLVGGRIVERFGIGRMYRTALVLRTLIWTGVAMLYDPVRDFMPFMPLVALSSLDLFVHSIGRVAEHSLHTIWFKDSTVASRRFSAFRDLIEYGTVFATMGTGLLIAHFKFGVVFYTAPFIFGAAALITFFLKGLPTAQEKSTVGFLTPFKFIFGDAGVRKLFLGQLLVNNFFYLLYYVTATVFSVFIAKGNKDFGAVISSAVTGAYGIGSILGFFVMNRISNGVEKKTAGIQDAKRQTQAQRALYAQTGAKALKWAAVGLMSAWLFIPTTVLVSVGVVPILVSMGLILLALIYTQVESKGVKKGIKWGALLLASASLFVPAAAAASLGAVPVFASSLGLIITGLTAGVALSHLDSAFKERIPKFMETSVNGANRALLQLSYSANFILWGTLFQLFAAKAFVLFGLACVVVALAYWWLARSMRAGAAADLK